MKLLHLQEQRVMVIVLLLLLQLLARLVYNIIYLSGVKGSPFMIISRRVGVSRNALKLRFPLVV